jgi:hypothetical protein
MPIQTSSGDTRTFLQTSLEICERLFQESSFSSVPFTIMDIESLAEKASIELKRNKTSKILTSPFTILVSRNYQSYKVKLNIPDFIPKGLVFDRLSELKENIYREFDRKEISYSN